MKRIGLGVALVGASLLAGCSRARDGAPETPAEQLEAWLRPTAQAAALRKLPGAHLTGSALFRVAPTAHADAAEGVTTTTDLTLDRQGQYRLVESNDRDGGREVVLYGKELAVAIRPGKLIRRAAQEPEPTRLLEEAVGGPWAAWETVHRFAAVEPTGPGSYRITRSARPVAVAASFAESTPLRRWRDSVTVDTLDGEARVDPQTGALLSFACKAHFSAFREDHTALAGELAVSTKLDAIGRTVAIAAPAAEPLPVRQRTILEERALLGDLGHGAKEGHQ